MVYVLAILRAKSFASEPVQTKNILLSFCQKQIAKRFLVKHFGSNVTGTYYYLIGELITTNQEEYRVYISNNKTHIESIEITKPRDT